MHSRSRLVSAAVMAGLAAGPALAQDRNEARGLFLELSQGLEAATNPELIADPQRDQFAARTDLDLRYFTATSRQRIDLAIGGAFEVGDFAERGESPRVAEKRISFGYLRNSAAGVLELDASYDRALIEDTTLIEGFEGDDLEITSGERGTGRLSFGLEVGKDRPVGLTMEGDYSTLRYFDSEGEGRDTVTYDSALRFSAGQRTDLLFLVGANQKDYNGDNEYQTDTISAGVGLRHELTARQRVRTELRAMRVQTSENSDLTGLRETETEKGPSALLDYEVDFGRQTFGIGYQSMLFNTGRRDTLGLSQKLALPGGELLLSAGVTDSDLLDAEPLFGIAWTQEMSRGRLQVELEQDAYSGEDDEETVRTSLSLGYVGQINSLSSWEVGASYAELDEFGEEASGSSRGEVSVGYRHALAEDWDMAVRYRHTVSSSDARSDRKNDSIYLGLTTRLDIWP